MKPLMAGAFGALALTLASSPLLAQTTTTIVAKPSGYVLVSPEQQVIVQRYVVTQPGTQVTLPPSYSPDVGSVVPADVELRTFTTGVDYGGFNATSYRYVTSPTGTLLVEPDTRRVIQVIP